MPTSPGAVAKKVTKTDCPGTSLCSDASAVSVICTESAVPAQLFPSDAVTFGLETNVKPSGIEIIAEPNLFPGGFEASLVIVII
jgi:hypothetical protein